ncbi:hypothetical protein FRC11_003509, partial [Ceratobasidium sp. 423]
MAELQAKAHGAPEGWGPNDETSDRDGQNDNGKRDRAPHERLTSNMIMTMGTMTVGKTAKVRTTVTAKITETAEMITNIITTMVRAMSTRNLNAIVMTVIISKTARDMMSAVIIPTATMGKEFFILVGMGTTQISIPGLSATVVEITSILVGVMTIAVITGNMTISELTSLMREEKYGEEDSEANSHGPGTDSSRRNDPRNNRDSRNGSDYCDFNVLDDYQWDFPEGKDPGPEVQVFDHITGTYCNADDPITHIEREHQKSVEQDGSNFSDDYDDQGNARTSPKQRERENSFGEG